MSRADYQTFLKGKKYMGKFRNNAVKAISLLLSLTIVIGTLSITAFADEQPQTSTTGTVELPTVPGGGGNETVDVTITITNNEDGTSTTTTETPAGGDTTGSGLNVNYSDTTLTGGSDGSGALISDESSYTVDSADGTYHVEGGSTTTVGARPITTPVDVPLTDDPTNDENTNTVTGNAIGTTTVIDGDTNGGTYDCSSETVISQGSVTVSTTDITITETVNSGNDLTHIFGETEPTADNDLCSSGSLTSADVKDGYEYVYVGMGNCSQFFASYLFTTPANEGDEPVYTDENGQSYYYHGTRTDSKYYVEGLYLNGELVEGIDEKFLTNRSGTLQFVFYDPNTGTYSTAYCADISTGAVTGYSYKIVNLEDSDYYTDHEAAMIRTIALNGYWGTTGTTESGEPVLGSLSAVQEMMKNATDADGNRIFTDDEVDSLTDGIALSATQYAIWAYSNKANNIEFVNAYFVNKNENNVMFGNCWNDIPAEKQSSVDLLFKLYDYLVNLTPTSAEQSTADTIINQDNFLKNLSVTVVEKAEHENNLDDDNTNDAYVTNLTFALVVTPSTENGDDLVVTVVDKSGNTLASGRVAGELKEGETLLIADEDGNYTFSGITLIEGEQNFNITLEGVQNLEQGVYLYTSEVRNGESSQTMVGIAEGERSVDVSMNIKFEFSVEEEIVAREHVWRSERVSDNDDNSGNNDAEELDRTYKENGGEENTDIPDNDVPFTDIPEGYEDIPDYTVPLASVPKTGDNSGWWLMLITLCGVGLLALDIIGKRREEDA